MSCCLQEGSNNLTFNVATHICRKKIILVMLKLPIIAPFFLSWVLLPVFAQEFLTPQELNAGLNEGRFDGLIDVRTQAEFDAGHIAGATLIENLGTTGNADLLMGCETCTLAVYCQSGNRAAAAIRRLQNEFGFTGTLYNGQGVIQWLIANYQIYGGMSVPAPCTRPDFVCAGQIATTPPFVFPSAPPSDSSSLPSDSPSQLPTVYPSQQPSNAPSLLPTDYPHQQPSASPSQLPSQLPSDSPSELPSKPPTLRPSTSPSTLSPTPDAGSGSCLGYDGECMFASDCCSSICKLGHCQKKTNPAKAKLVGSGHGGAAGKLRSTNRG